MTLTTSAGSSGWDQYRPLPLVHETARYKGRGFERYSSLVKSTSMPQGFSISPAGSYPSLP